MSLDQPLCTGNALEFEYWREIIFLFIFVSFEEGNKSFCFALCAVLIGS